MFNNNTSTQIHEQAIQLVNYIENCAIIEDKYKPTITREIEIQILRAVVDDRHQRNKENG